MKTASVNSEFNSSVFIFDEKYYTIVKVHVWMILSLVSCLLHCQLEIDELIAYTAVRHHLL